MKKLKELSHKRRFTRFFKYLKDNKFEGLDIQLVKQAERPAPHAVQLGISTKQTITVLGIGASEKDMKYCVTFRWTHKDNYTDKKLEDLVRVSLELLDHSDPRKSQCLVAKSFNLDGDKISVNEKNKGKKEHSDILDKYIKLATEFFWETPNSLKFIKE